MLKSFLALLAAAMLLAAPAAFAADSKTSAVVGTIIAVEGTATVQHGGKKIQAKPDTQVFSGDIVETGAKSKALIMLIDDSQFTLGEKAKFSIKEYVIDDDAARNHASDSIMNGAFKYISGLMTKTEDPDVNISTRYGTIGIRGTTLYGGNLNGLFQLFLEHGLIDLINGGGGETLDDGEGTTVGGSNEDPTGPTEWTEEQIKEIKALVEMDDWAAILKLIEKQKKKNKALRELYKKFLEEYIKFSLRLRDLPNDGLPPGFPFIPLGEGGTRGGGGGGS